MLHKEKKENFREEDFRQKEQEKIHLEQYQTLEMMDQIGEQQIIQEQETIQEI